MSYPLTSTDPLEPKLPDDQDMDGFSPDEDPVQKFALCTMCNQIVPIVTNYVTVGEDEVMWETVCAPHGHIINED